MEKPTYEQLVERLELATNLLANVGASEVLKKNRTEDERQTYRAMMYEAVGNKRIISMTK